MASEQKTVLGVNISSRLKNIIPRGVVAKYFNKGARIYRTPWAIHILNLTCGWTHPLPPLYLYTTLPFLIICSEGARIPTRRVRLRIRVQRAHVCACSAITGGTCYPSVKGNRSNIFFRL